MNDVARHEHDQSQWWQRLEQVCDSTNAAPDPPNASPLLDRREALKLMSAALTASVGACSPPREEIVPYVRMPERLTPGEPLTFATALTFAGVAQPILAISHEGRPTKIEGNREHPSSAGATDAFAQAALLSLYDPGRSRAPLHQSQISSWDALQGALAERSRQWRSGAKVGILTGSVTSPSLADQLQQLASIFPRVTWRVWEPVNGDAVLRGAEMAFGRRLEPRYHLEKSAVVLALDDDFLGPGPQQVAYARGFAMRRRARHDSTRLLRLHVAESTLSLTGAAADHRLAIRRNEVAYLARAIAKALGADIAVPELQPAMRDFVTRAVRELQAHRGEALVVAGVGQPAEVHALAHWANAQLGALGATVIMIEPMGFEAESHAENMRALVDDMQAGRLDALLVLNANPAYDAPSDLDFSAAMRKVPFTLHLGLHADETAGLSTWHVPALHDLECWGDARAFDGSTCLAQPLITPLYQGYSVRELLALLTGEVEPSGYRLLRTYWQGHVQTSDFEQWWRTALHDGHVANTAAPGVTALSPILPALPPVATSQPPLELSFHPDPSVWDGRFANNAWLQELPRPLTKQVWGNALHVSPSDAVRLDVRDGDVVTVALSGRSLEIPILVAPGQAQGSVALHLGYGRQTGAVAKGIGSDANKLRVLNDLWAVTGVTFVKTGHRQPLANTQTTKRMEGRDIVRSVSREALSSELRASPEEPKTLYPSFPAGDHAWAMVIDQSVCIGCNACIVACQAENNVPVVGPDEVRRGRDMHWLRVDTYFQGPPESPQTSFQPVPCMHCEKAPCEPMCPVEAAVHDSEGLNVQVYNRCIGTRFCQANCPYKVRRFNFFGYGDGPEYANLGAPIVQALHNPDVSVRARGVMEKCTYCVQRISRARRLAEREGRDMREGDVVTACQSACPVEAITFGDLQRPESEVNKLRREPHHYALLEHLGTRPRTTYLARVREPDADRERSQ